MKILAIKQTSSGQNIHFITDKFSEYTLEELVIQVEKLAIQGIKIFTSKSGKKSLRLQSNKTTEDNLERAAITCNDGDYLFFDRHYLFLKSKNGRIKKKWAAFSGNSDSRIQDQNKPDFGPLPEGEYTVFFTKTLDVQTNEGLWDSLKWIEKSPAWGFVVTPLQQVKGNPYGRGNFYIHGGLFKGTKGCIEINNLENSHFHAFIRLYKRDFKLIVKYS